MSRYTVVGIIEEEAGTQFDPDLVPLFLGLDFTGFERLVDEYSADEVITPPEHGDAA